MQAPPANVAGRPVLYAGRFAPKIKEAGTPEGCVLLGDWDVLLTGWTDRSRIPEVTR